MMMVAKAVTTGHHCGSFQSVQKSQSPANSNLVMSAAPATMKIAVIQKTASQVRSMKRYFAFSSSRSSRRRCLSAGAMVAGVDAMLSPSETLGFLGGNYSVFLAAGCGGVLYRHFLGAAGGLLDLEKAQDGLTPNRKHAAGEPSVSHERPVERGREELLGHPQAMAPFV